MQHYWGAKAICDRIGYRCSNRLPDLIIRYHVPAYKRHHPHKHCIVVYYSNEELLSKWDLARAQHDREKLIADREQRKTVLAEKVRDGLRGKGK